MYVIVSPRIGTPGDPYEPHDGVNVDALIEGGLISTDKPKSRLKSKQNQSRRNSSWQPASICPTQASRSTRLT